MTRASQPGQPAAGHGDPAPGYLVPAAPARAELLVVNSHFIGSLAPAFSVDEAKAFLAQVRAEYPDASHHVPAYVIGRGNTVITHCSDDGEPSGTAGRPALAVLEGSGLGDVAVVVTRYFGGTKLGTGGLVRAYGDAVRQVLAATRRAQKIVVHKVLVRLPYHLFEQGRGLIVSCGGVLLAQEFAAEVSLTAQFPLAALKRFQAGLGELTNGQGQAVVLETGPVLLPLP